MKLSAILAPLIAAKVPHEIIMQTVQAFEAQQSDALERRRANDRERQERRRHVKSREVTVTVSSHAGATRVEDNLLTKITTGKKETKERAPAALTPCSELLAVLDAERAQAVVDHRQRLRKPLTAHAAKLLAKRLGTFPDPNAAADRMIEKGWLNIEAGWGEPSPQRATSPPVKQTVGQQARDDLKRMMNDAPDFQTRHHLESDGSPGFAGTGIARRIALAASGRGGH